MWIERALLLVAVGALALGGTSCGIIAPGCVDHTIATVEGRVDAGQVVTHLMRYELKSGQNFLEMTWPPGQLRTDGLRPRMYATSATCAAFVVPTAENPYPNIGTCQVISTSSGFQMPDGEIIYNRLVITGPGNGAPNDFREYKLHVVGDPRHAADYFIAATWKSGPNCS